jgi:hypothetical protein
MPAPDLQEHQQAPEDGAGLPRPGQVLTALLPEDSWATRPPRIDDVPPGTTTSDSPGLDEDFEDGSPSEPSGTAGSTGSTKGSRGGSLADFRRGSARVYGALAATVAGALSGIANMALRDKDDPDDDSWLMLPEEAQGIGEPLGRIASRRITLPVGEGESNDLMDGFEAVMAGLAYVTRNLISRAQRRADRRRTAAPDPMQQGQEQAA